MVRGQNNAFMDACRLIRKETEIDVVHLNQKQLAACWSISEVKITVAMTRRDAIWNQLLPAEQTWIVKLLLEKVIVSPNDFEARLRSNGIERLALEPRPEPAEQQEGGAGIGDIRIQKAG